MAYQLPKIDQTGEVSDLSLVDSALFKSAREALPSSLLKKLGVRGSQKMPTKERITIRLSPEVVAAFRASGDGWQTRMDAALRGWLKLPKKIQKQSLASR